MKLIYRGVTYDYDPTRDPIDDRFDRIREPLTLTYRGNRYQISPNQAMPDAYRPRAAYQLTYRGNKYWVHRPIEEPTVRPVPSQAREKLVKELDRVHRENLQRNLYRRIEAARQKGDLSLLAMLEDERRHLV